MQHRVCVCAYVCVGVCVGSHTQEPLCLLEQKSHLRRENWSSFSYGDIYADQLAAPECLTALLVSSDLQVLYTC